MRLHIKRVFEQAAGEDGKRILVDRLWPRGLSKDKARIDYWAKDLAPSSDLRRWFGHDPAKWEEFKRRYFAELDASPEAVAELKSAIGDGPATLVYAARDRHHNNARALMEYLLGG